MQSGAETPTATYEQPPAPGRAPRRGRGTGRGLFWVGFAVGFVALTIASCSGVAATLGFGRLSLADLRGGGSVWAPPTLAPTPTAPLVAEGDAAQAVTSGGRFAAGSLARNITGTRVNVRRTPGHLGKGADDVLVQITPGEQVEIQGETTSADGLTWYRVLYQGLDGWVAEATASGVQILGQ